MRYVELNLLTASCPIRTPCWSAVHTAASKFLPRTPQHTHRREFQPTTASASCWTKRELKHSHDCTKKSFIWPGRTGNIRKFLNVSRSSRCVFVFRGGLRTCPSTFHSILLLLFFSVPWLLNELMKPHWQLVGLSVKIRAAHGVEKRKYEAQWWFGKGDTGTLCSVGTRRICDPFSSSASTWPDKKLVDCARLKLSSEEWKQGQGRPNKFRRYTFPFKQTWQKTSTICDIFGRGGACTRTSHPHHKHRHTWFDLMWSDCPSGQPLWWLSTKAISDRVESPRIFGFRYLNQTAPASLHP